MSERRSDLRIVNLYDKTPGVRLGIIRTLLVKNAFSMNIEATRNLTRYAARIGVKTVILPPSLPYGLNTGDLKSADMVSAASINCRNPFVRIIKHIAGISGFNVIIPYVIENTHGKYYVSNLFVGGSPPVCRFISRKIVLLDSEKELNIKPGTSIELIDDDYLKYFIQLDLDANYVEISKLAIYMGAELLITTFFNYEDQESLRNKLLALNITTGVPVVHTGYLIKEDNMIKTAPTMIFISPEEYYEFNGSDTYLITIPMKLLKSIKKHYKSDEIGSIMEILYKQTRRIRAFKGLYNKYTIG